MLQSTRSPKCKKRAILEDSRAPRLKESTGRPPRRPTPSKSNPVRENDDPARRRLAGVVANVPNASDLRMQLAYELKQLANKHPAIKPLIRALRDPGCEPTI